MKYRKHLDNIERISSPSIDLNKKRLNSAERDIPIYEGIWDKFLENLKETDIRYYPDINRVVEKIAQHEHVDVDQVTVGAGSDQVIRNIFEAFVEPGYKVVTTDPCFPMYYVYGNIYDVNVRMIPYKDKKKDITGIINAIDPSTSLVIVSNPSSPVGDSFGVDELKLIIGWAQKNDCLVVVDEAYIQFATDTKSLVLDVNKYENLIVLKTFSKAVGSAGIRFGYGISNSKITNILSKVKSMYEITGPTITWVETIVDNYRDIVLYSMIVKQNRTLLIQGLREAGHEVIEGQCNWIHTDKLVFPDHIVTRQCKLPWSDKTWTRLCVPASSETLLEIL